jgi:hypothetical protein
MGHPAKGFNRKVRKEIAKVAKKSKIDIGPLPLPTIVGEYYFRRIGDGGLRGKLFCAMRSCLDALVFSHDIHGSTF